MDWQWSVAQTRGRNAKSRSANKSRREVQHAHPKVSLDPVASLKKHGHSGLPSSSHLA